MNEQQLPEDYQIIIDLLSDDKKMICYRPKFNKFTGSVTATILLQQIIYWAKNNNNYFYKFKLPCNHPDYKEGDSFCEELGFSKKEFENAIKQLKSKNLIQTKVTQNRKTFYSVNYIELVDLIKSNSLNPQTVFRKIPKEDLGKSPKGILENTQSGFTIITENTSKNTTDIKKINKKNNLEELKELNKNSIQEYATNLIQNINQTQKEWQSKNARLVDQVFNSEVAKNLIQEEVENINNWIDSQTTVKKLSPIPNPKARFNQFFELKIPKCFSFKKVEYTNQPTQSSPNYFDNYETIQASEDKSTLNSIRFTPKTELTKEEIEQAKIKANSIKELMLRASNLAKSKFAGV
jgi:DNA-binding transcriptional regulator GbsR (MarR family)